MKSNNRVELKCSDQKKKKKNYVSLLNYQAIDFKYLTIINYTSIELGNGEGNGTPLQYSCLGNPMDRGAWWAAVHSVAKSQTWLSDFTFTFHFHALEKEMATHSSVLAWRIPGTGEPGGLVGAVYGVAQSRTQLKRLISSSSRARKKIKVKLLPLKLLLTFEGVKKINRKF